MKKKDAFLAAALTVAVFPAHGQLLSALDLLPLTGDSFRFHGVTDDELFVAGPPGFGLTWDHGALQIVTGNYSQLTCVDPASAPHIANYPTSDLVMNRTIDLDPAYFNYQYYDHEEPGIYQTGAVGEVLSYAYDVPELVNAIPLFAGTPVTADFCYTSNGLGQSYHFCGESREELDGGGTLILPYGTFPNVLRTTYQHYQVEDATPADTIFTLYHRWWVPGLRRPILEQYTFTGSNGESFVSVSVMAEGSVVGLKEVAPLRARFYPVPFRDRLTIDLAAPVRTPAELEVLTPDGRLVYRTTVPKGIGQWQVDASSLPGGPLLIGLTTEGTRLVQTVIHER